jgi:hypothetical protein
MTSPQNKIVEFMRQHGGVCWIQTGHKAVILQHDHPAAGGPVIGLSVNTFEGLRRNGIVEPLKGFKMMFKLTEAYDK